MNCNLPQFIPPEHKTPTPDRPRLIRKDEVRRRLGNLPISSFYRMISNGKIPPGIHPKGGRSAFWVESEIDKVISEIIAEARKGAVE